MVTEILIHPLSAHSQWLCVVMKGISSPFALSVFQEGPYNIQIFLFFYIFVRYGLFRICSD